MSFVVSYEICALLFMGIVAVHFFSRYQFPNLQNKFFAFFIVCGMLDNILDIAGSFAIDMAATFPYWLLMLINSLFYCFQVMLPAVFFLYILCITQTLSKKSRLEIGLALIPLVLSEIGVVLNIWLGIFFYFDSSLGYHHGAWYSTLFIGMGFYFILTVIYLLKYRSRLRQSQFITIIAYIMLILLAASIQAVFPEYLLTGAALALAVCMMYLTLQNPAEMLDDMTGLFNRSCFLRYLNDSFDRRGSRHSVVLIALDDMRTVNSMFGANLGNQLIVEVARFLNSSPRRVQAFKLVGDQFVLECSNDRACMDAVRVISERFKRPWRVSDVEINLTTCVCYCPNADFTEVRDDVLLLFDYVVAAAKAKGRGTVIEFGGSALSRLQRERAIETSLSEAVENGTLDVYFQPICSADGSLHSAEALVRFRHETMGMIPPDEFIPLAEKNGLIIRVGELVLRKVCAYIREAGLLGRPGFDSIEMNLSAIELLQPDLPKRLLAILDEFDVPPAFLNFEVTETTATVASSAILENMQALRACGARFALDDFGTGYANLDSVLQLPFSCVKLDRSMLVASFLSDRSAVVLEHMVKLIQTLGFDTVVEGAETAEQVAFLSRLGVDYIQGYYFSRPLPAADFTAYAGRAIPAAASSRS